MISGVYDYSSPEVQEGLERLILQLENTTYIAPFYTESWLREFLDFVRRNKDYNPIDISTEASFIRGVARDAGGTRAPPEFGQIG